MIMVRMSNISDAWLILCFNNFCFLILICLIAGSSYFFEYAAWALDTARNYDAIQRVERS